MTRVNLIPVQDLTDQHLMAEYRELTMVPAALNRTLNSKTGLVKKKIAESFTLNKGHVYFFYDKGQFLDKRYTMLVKELKKRGFDLDPNRLFPTKIFKDNGLYHNYYPTDAEIAISKERIDYRISQKPGWYRWYGKTV